MNNKTKRVNLTQHKSSAKQECLARNEKQSAQVRTALTFIEAPSIDEINHRCELLLQFAQEQAADEALIGGAGYIIVRLVTVLREAGIKPVFSFTQRESKEVTLPDGSVRKTSFFNHLCFIEAQA